MSRTDYQNNCKLRKGSLTTSEPFAQLSIEFLEARIGDLERYMYPPSLQSVVMGTINVNKEMLARVKRTA